MKSKVLFLLFLISFSQLITAQNFQNTDAGIKAKTQSMQIELQFYSPEIVRVVKYPGGKILDKTSLSVVKIADKTGWQIAESPNTVTFTSSKLKVELNLTRAKGDLLLLS